MPQNLLAKVKECSRRGWSWITEHLASFIPPDFKNPNDLKPISELSLIYSTVFAHSPKHRQQVLKPVGLFLLDFFRDASLAQYARKSPSLYNPYIMGYLPLRVLGYRLPYYEEAISYVRRSGYPGALELVPYRALELEYIMHKAFRPRGRRTLLRKAAHTVLWRCKSPVYLTLSEVYSVTHTLFYLSDFGSASLPLDSEQHRRQLAITETLVVDFWRRRNWDVTAEILLNLVSLNASDSVLFLECANALLGAWQFDGALPGPTPPDSAKDRQEFDSCYHTTLVGLLFCNGYEYNWPVKFYR